MIYDITYNGICSKTMGVAVKTRPDIPSPSKRGEFVEIAGRNGSLLQSDGTYENLAFSIEMNYVRRPHAVMKTFREIKRWLSGSGELILGDDQEVFYKVKAIETTNEKRKAKIGYDFKADVIADPFCYFVNGKIPVECTGSMSLHNGYDECCPTYIVNGEGTCRLIVNGYALDIAVNTELIIDTDKLLVYTPDGVIRTVDTSGADLEELRFVEGNNEIDFRVDTGLVTLSIIPNWRAI